MAERIVIFTASWTYMPGEAKASSDDGERERLKLARSVSELRQRHPEAQVEYLLSSAALQAAHEYKRAQTLATLVAIVTQPE